MLNAFGWFHAGLDQNEKVWRHALADKKAREARDPAHGPV